jgi:hypothetical protein
VTVVWDGRGELTEGLERDYADMRGDGWDLIWEPTSDLTTPWWKYEHMCWPDPNEHVETAIARKPKRLRPSKVLGKDWTRIYDGTIDQQKSGR